MTYIQDMRPFPRWLVNHKMKFLLYLSLLVFLPVILFYRIVIAVKLACEDVLYSAKDLWELKE